MIEGYILDVGCGNMVAVKFPNGKTMMIDCNLTEDNKVSIVNFLKKKGFGKIDVFLNTHRDADHLRNIKYLDDNIPIAEIWDNGVAGATDETDYKEYMALRRGKKHIVIKPRTLDNNGIWGDNVIVRYMNGDYDDVSYDINDTSIVLKIDYKGSSILLAGDTSYKPWKEKILPYYAYEKISSNLLLGSHHGSITFFDDPNDTQNYYTKHVATIKPAMSIISVGANSYGLPDKKAIEFYEKYSTGSDKGNKLWRTDKQGNIKFELKGNGSWSMTPNIS